MLVCLDYFCELLVLGLCRLPVFRTCCKNWLLTMNVEEICNCLGELVASRERWCYISVLHVRLSQNDFLIDQGRWEFYL